MPTTNCRRLFPLAAIVGISLAGASSESAGSTIESAPRVEGNEIVSTAFPCARIRVKPPLVFVGRHDFEIGAMAAGERLVFVEAREGKVTRFWMAQFEAIVPGSSEIYRYGFQDAVTLGGIEFKPGTFAYSNREAAAETPPNEGVLTARFLAAKGYLLPDELMMARFAAVPDAAKRHELILFYGENVADTGHALRELYEGDNRTALWDGIAKGLYERAVGSFEVLPGCGS